MMIFFSCGYLSVEAMDGRILGLRVDEIHDTLWCMSVHNMVRRRRGQTCGIY